MVRATISGVTSPGSDTPPPGPQGVDLPTETPADAPAEPSGMTSRITAGLSPSDDEPEAIPSPPSNAPSNAPLSAPPATPSSFLDAPAPTRSVAPPGMTSRSGFTPVPPPPTVRPGVAPLPPTASSPGFAPVPAPYPQQSFGSVPGMAPVPPPGAPYAAPGQRPGVPVSPYTGPQPGLPITQTGPQPGLPIGHTGPQPGLPVGQPTPGAPQYAPPGYAPVATARRAVPLLAVFSVVALLLAGGLALAGSFLTLDTFATHTTYPGVSDTSTVSTAWSFNYQPATGMGSRSQYLGVPLVVGGGLALLAAVLLIVALGRPLAWARAVGAVSGAVLFGAALTVAMSVLTDLGFASTARDSVTTVSPGLGFWLILGGGVLAAGATVLTLPTGRTTPTHPG